MFFLSKAFFLTSELSHLSCSGGTEIALEIRELTSSLPAESHCVPVSKGHSGTSRRARSKPRELEILFPRKQAPNLIVVNRSSLMIGTVLSSPRNPQGRNESSHTYRKRFLLTSLLSPYLHFHTKTVGLKYTKPPTGELFHPVEWMGPEPISARSASRRTA